MCWWKYAIGMESASKIDKLSIIALVDNDFVDSLNNAFKNVAGYKFEIGFLESVQDLNFITASDRLSAILVQTDFSSLPDIVSRVNRQFSSNKVPIVVLDAQWNEAQANSASNHGADGYLTITELNRLPWMLQRLTNQWQKEDKRESNLRTLFYEAPLAKLVYEPTSYKITLANQMAVNLYGYSRKELTKMTVRELRPDSDKNEIRDNVLCILTNGKTVFKSTHINSLGQEIRVETSSSVIEFDGKPHVVVTVKDITEEDLWLKEIEKLSLVASNATNGIIITDVNEIIEWVNPGFERLSGYMAEELIGKKPADILQGPDTNTEHKETLRRHVAERKPLSIEIVNYRKSGKPYWVEINLSPVFSDDGELTNFIAVQTDVTERKLDEELLVESKAIAEQALSKLKYQKFALDQHSIVAVTDIKGTITYANTKFCEISGYPADDLIGANHRILNSGYHEMSFFKGMYSTIGRGEVWQAEVKNRRKDGTYYWVDTTIVPYVDEKTRKPIQFIAIRTDITTRKEAELQIQRNLENLEEIVHERTSELLKTAQQLEFSHDEVMSGMRYAKRIQDTVLPSVKEISNLFNDGFVYFRPKELVSGDFFWLHQKRDEIILSVVDCTGHGVPGAMMSMLGNELLNSIVISNNITQPDRVLVELDVSISQKLKRDLASFTMNDGMDMSICSIDREAKTLTFAGAQSRGLLITKEGAIKLEPARSPIGGGVSTDMTFQSQTISYSDGDRLFLYTDGYYDQFGGEKNKKFLRKNFESFLLETSQLSLQKQKDALRDQFEKWIGREEQVDDVTVIGVEF